MILSLVIYWIVQNEQTCSTFSDLNIIHNNAMYGRIEFWMQFNVHHQGQV